MQYYESSVGEWLTIQVIQTTADGINYYYIENLTPKTRYIFHLSILYNTESEVFLWPPDNRFTFRTLGDRPTTPGTPVLQHLRGDVYQVAWDPSKENGGVIELYSLEGRQASGNEPYISQNDKSDYTNSTTGTSSISPTSQEWTIFYNGTGKNIMLYIFY